MDLKAVLKQCYDSALTVNQGHRAAYIPELATVDHSLMAISVCDKDGATHSVGDSDHPFTLQSISKVLAYAYVLENFSEDKIFEKVGVEPSGEEFDSIIKLDRFQRPFNPMVNAGAIAITDLLISKFGDDALKNSLEFFASFLNKKNVVVNESVFQSEWENSSRNRALAHYLKSFDILENPVNKVLELYFQHCSVEVTTEDLAQFGGALARYGHDSKGADVLSNSSLTKLLSVMLSCGMYTYSGQWIYEIGLPAKSGVSGGILAIVPGEMGIGVFSPRINADGCSYRGAHAVKHLTDTMDLHIF